jgi:hypothetical protein
MKNKTRFNAIETMLKFLEDHEYLSDLYSELKEIEELYKKTEIPESEKKKVDSRFYLCINDFISLVIGRKESELKSKSLKTTEREQDEDKLVFDKWLKKLVETAIKP